MSFCCCFGILIVILIRHTQLGRADNGAMASAGPHSVSLTTVMAGFSSFCQLHHGFSIMIRGW
jgi:hypothetical protein